MMSPAARCLLQMALRVRPPTRTELISLVELDEAAAESALEELVLLGHLELSGENLLVHPPQRAAGAYLADQLSALQAQVAADTDAIAGQLAELQGLQRDWELGHTAQHEFEVEFVHGPMAPRDAGMAAYARNPLLSSCAVIPDALRLQAPPPPMREWFIEMLQAKPEPDRILIGTHDASTPGIADALATYTAAGALLRVHDGLPSWFAINSDDSMALPLTWGDSWPTSVMTIHHSVIASVARMTFDLLWSQAQPIAPDDLSWRPLVRLLMTGSTLEAAALTLRISTRTARRRINEAMRFHRARTTFELGVILGRAQAADAPRTDSRA